MKKFFTLILAIAFVLSLKATTFTFTSSSDVSQTKDGITVTLSKGSGNNDPFFSSSEEMRLYANNTITISGGNITDVYLSFAKQGSKDYASLSASPGTLVSGGTSTSNTDKKTDHWTGSSSSITFTLGTSGQRILREIIVNGSASSVDPSDPSTPDNPDLPSTLDPDYKYPEPTSVSVPSMTVQGDAYYFIDNNIQVSCTRGAVNQNYFSAHAGFDMTFMATQPIKGIVINGFVKKDFEATVNHGKVSYLTPDADAEAIPVVVITDVNSTSVTISCIKQLRCYSVLIYFDANPEATVDGGSAGSGGSSTVDLTYDTAEAVYESEFSDWLGEDNYSVFLYNASDPIYPYVSLDIYPDGADLTGTYKMSDYSLGDYTYYLYGENEDDIAWALSGEISISRNGELYNISGYIVCDNNIRYNLTYAGPLPVYLDSDYYGDDDDASVGDITIDKSTKVTQEYNPEEPAFDLYGRKVGQNAHGIIIQKGKKFIIR